VAKGKCSVLYAIEKKLSLAGAIDGGVSWVNLNNIGASSMFGSVHLGLRIIQSN